tara:strand:+ start:545 stop:730 length:186 start_codon:yes stop_codon:yes gene_type:complete
MATASRKRTVTAPLAMLPAPTERKGMLALVTRMYNHRDGGLALFVEDGEASFESLTLKALP